MKKCMIADYISGGLAYGIRKGTCLPDTTRWPHCHEFLEIVYVCDGKGVHYIDDKAYDVKRGTVLFIDRDQAHSFTASETMTYVNFYINPAAISEQLSEIRSVYELLAFLFPAGNIPTDRQPPTVELDSAFLSEMQARTESVRREMRLKRYGYELAVDGHMRIIYSGILRTLVPTCAKRRKIVLSDILEYVERNYTRRITLTDLARQLYYSPVYLGKLFKSTFGTTFKHYVLEKRLEQASSLLVESDMTVEEVSAAAGFSDKKFFYLCFKEKYRCTPLQYRHS